MSTAYTLPTTTREFCAAVRVPRYDLESRAVLGDNEVFEQESSAGSQPPSEVATTIFVSVWVESELLARAKLGWALQRAYPAGGFELLAVTP